MYSELAFSILCMLCLAAKLISLIRTNKGEVEFTNTKHIYAQVLKVSVRSLARSHFSVNKFCSIKLLHRLAYSPILNPEF